MADPRLCAVEECDKPVEARGWCMNHYYRWRKHGDPLGGRTPDGTAMRFFREHVLAHDADECLQWPFIRNTKGYGLLHVSGRLKYVTRLVCEEEHGPPPSPDHEAAHSCGKGHEGCVARRHLSWKTPVENCADRVVHGTATRGMRNASARLTDDDVHEIRALRGVLNRAAIAARFGVTKDHISSIQTGKVWRSV